MGFFEADRSASWSHSDLSTYCTSNYARTGCIARRYYVSSWLDTTSCGTSQKLQLMFQDARSSRRKAFRKSDWIFVRAKVWFQQSCGLIFHLTCGWNGFNRCRLVALGNSPDKVSPGIHQNSGWLGNFLGLFTRSGVYSDYYNLRAKKLISASKLAGPRPIAISGKTSPMVWIF